MITDFANVGSEYADRSCLIFRVCVTYKYIRAVATVQMVHLTPLLYNLLRSYALPYLFVDWHVCFVCD